MSNAGLDADEASATPGGADDLVSISAVARVGWLVEGLNMLGTSMILMIMGVMIYDIGGRLLFGQPFAGVPEMVAIGVVAIVFLQLPNAVASGSLIRSDAIVGILARKALVVGRAAQLINSLVGAALFSAIAYSAWHFLVRAWELGHTYGSYGVFEVPQWPLRLIVVVGAAMTAVQFLRLAYVAVRGRP